MFSSPPRVRLWTQTVFFLIVFLLTLVIMGTIGVNGSISFENLEKGCLLYITIDDKDVPHYKNAYCHFPIVAAAVICLFTLVFMALGIMVLRRKEEYAPRNVSISLLAASLFLTLFSFAITGEIGIGLKKGCESILPNLSLALCRSSNNFSSLYVAQVCSGLMGGVWLFILVLEWFNFKSRPSRLA
ncbi:hypothetical protein EMPS_05916 [Entomortierella parvispora]|uniref:Uncharacterized protein n=1 Tax=Entomortierella parvispora TaxID=205924 RepID=A0A9P3HBS3_9FUNG|nr:hypothetical protein EMPS_05916 [Entomortierella parvispora]